MALIFQLDRLPDEVVLEILKYAMIRDTPFDLSDCIRTAMHERSRVKQRLNQTLDDDSCFPMSPEETEKWGWTKDDEARYIRQDHLRDWRIAGSVCRRIRRLGKEAFFSSKVIAMDIPLATKLQGHALSCLSLEDQQTASKYINSIVLIDHLTAASPWIKLPRCIAGFPRLRFLDFHFEDDQWDSYAKERVQLPSHFRKVLIDIAVPMGNLAIGIETRNMRDSERKLKTFVYPGLKNWAKMKLAMGTKGKGTDST